MKIHINRANDDIRLSLFICVVILRSFITNLNNGLSAWTGISASLVARIFWLILGIAFVAIIPTFTRRLTLRMLIFVLVSMVVSALNFLIFPNTTVYFTDTILNFFTLCLTVCIVIGMIQDFNVLLDALVRTSYVIALITAFLLVGVFTRIVPSFNDGNYSMGFGYACLFPILILISMIFLRRSITAAVMAGILIVSLLAFGSRGPFLGIILFSLYFGARVLIIRKKYFWLLFAIAIIVLFMFFFQDILTGIANLFDLVGLQSRTIRLFISNSGSFYLSGRSDIYSVIWQAIKEHPFYIRGINADYVLVGIYSHNIFLELVYEFGAIIGGAVFLYLAWRIWKTLSFRELSEKNILCLLFMFASIPRLMISGTLWTNSMFWIWIAFSLFSSSKKNSEIQSEFHMEKENNF